MEDVKASPVERAIGLSLLAIGSVTLIDSLQVLQNGVLNLDSLVHTEISGGGSSAGQIKVSNGGVGMICDPDYAVDDFALGSSRALSSDLSDGRRAVRGSEVGAELRKRVRSIAARITAQSRDGALLVAGSTDPLKYRNNADLAAERAKVVRDELYRALGTTQAARTPRTILLANEVMVFPDANSGPADSPVSNGLARMLFGPKEVAGRTVVICLLEPRPHQVETFGGGESGSAIGTSYLQGVAVGLITMAATAGVALAIGILAWRALRGRMKPPSRPD